MKVLGSLIKSSVKDKLWHGGFPIDLTYNEKLVDFVTSSGQFLHFQSKNWATNFNQKDKTKSFAFYRENIKKWDLVDGTMLVTLVCQRVCSTGTLTGPLV